MENGWIMIFTSNNLQESEMIKDLLLENEITAVSLNKQSSMYLIGEIEIYVKNTDVILAKQLISKKQKD